MRNGPIAPADPGSTAVPGYLPLGFIAAGIVSFLFVAFELVNVLPSSLIYVRHNASLLVLVHLFTLTWGSGVTLGVLHQMTPVLVAARLFSVGLGWLSLALFVPGSLLLSLSFRSFWLVGVAAGGVLVSMGALVFVYNMMRTLGMSSERGATRTFLVASLASFIATLLAGLAMAVSLRFGTGLHLVDGLLGAHILLGAGGWFAGIIIGVSYRLIPMFLLVHGHSERLARWIFILLYGGVAVGIVGALSGGVLVLPGLIIAGIGVTLYAFDVFRMWRTRGRRPDVWLSQVPAAIGYVMASAWGVVAVTLWASGATLIPPRVQLALGLLFALGWVSTLIVALLHKIVPFLVWFHRYADAVGRASVPVMSDLVNERVGRVTFPVYHGALLVLVSAVASGGTSLAMVAAGVFALACIALMHDVLLLIFPVRDHAGPATSPERTPG